MSRITPFRRLLMNLRGELPEGRFEFLPPEQALEELRSSTGQDFGMDADAWEAWLRANTKELGGARPRKNSKLAPQTTGPRKS